MDEKVWYRGVASIFQRGFALCHNRGTYQIDQIGMLTSMPCFTLSDIISYEQWEWGGGGGGGEA